ncbi:hypothetical protein CEXT_507801 [Caerostris extrusa]|uniref:Uncharacterized protein n=1 Tax=Caerostris extrusa TaxID=172846 RepID=A0AAV4XC56_CAEEX|nr:hypothetical protein CEXT_507801 [Caerostris extrusa]
MIIFTICVPWLVGKRTSVRKLWTWLLGILCLANFYEQGSYKLIHVQDPTKSFPKNPPTSHNISLFSSNPAHPFTAPLDLIFHSTDRIGLVRGTPLSYSLPPRMGALLTHPKTSVMGAVHINGVGTMAEDVQGRAR